MYILQASEKIDQISLQSIDQQNRRGMLSIFCLNLFDFSKIIAVPLSFAAWRHSPYSSSTPILGKVTFVAALRAPVP